MKKPIGIKTEKLERIAYISAIIGFPLLVISTMVVLYQLHVATKIASSQNSIMLNTMFFHSEPNIRIIEAIENANNDPNNKKPIRKKNGGEFSDPIIDTYLGDFDTIYQAYVEGLLSQEELCTSFSYYITAATENKEIAEYASENAEYFDGIRELPKILAKSPRDCR